MGKSTFIYRVVNVSLKAHRKLFKKYWCNLIWGQLLSTNSSTLCCDQKNESLRDKVSALSWLLSPTLPLLSFYICA